VDKDFAQCNVRTCRKKYKTNNGSLEGLKKHLKIDHSVQSQSLTVGKKREQESSEDVEPEIKKSKINNWIESQTPYDKNSKKQKKFNEAVQGLFTQDLLPFSVVKGEGFKKLIKSIPNGNRLHIYNRSTYSKWISEKYTEVLTKVKDIILQQKKDLKSCCFTTDMWTSRSNHTYICLTVHFIDLEWKLHRWTPFIRHFPLSHTGANIEAKLEDFMSELDLHTDEMKLFCTIDGGANIRLAVELSQLTEFPCVNHCLHLVVMDSIKDTPGMQKATDICKSLAQWVHHASKASTELENACEKIKLNHKKLVQSVPTCWNSTFDCLQSVLHLKPAFEELSKESDQWRQKCPSLTEWKMIEGTSKLLAPFKVSTEIWSSEEIPTIHTIHRLFLMHDHLDNFLLFSGSNLHGKAFARSLKKIFKKGSQTLSVQTKLLFWEIF